VKAPFSLSRQDRAALFGFCCRIHLQLQFFAVTSSFVTVLAPDLAWILIPVQTSFHRCLLLPSAGSDLGFLLLARTGAS
jgi:hypothetical protein